MNFIVIYYSFSSEYLPLKVNSLFNSIPLGMWYNVTKHPQLEKTGVYGYIRYNFYYALESSSIEKSMTEPSKAFVYNIKSFPNIFPCCREWV